MRRKLLIRSLGLAAAIATLVFASTTHAAEFFPRDLRLGDSGQDVRNLQVALNLSAKTRVADSGAGAPGAETEYFGERTQSALVRYQMARGLVPADGVAAAATRSALQADLAGAVKAGGTAAASSKSAGKSQFSVPDGLSAALAEVGGGAGSPGVPSSFQTGKMVLFPDQAVAVKPGQPSLLFGLGFTPGESYSLVVASTSKTFGSAVASTSMTLRLKAPNVRGGTYRLYAAAEVGARSNEVVVYVSKGSQPTVVKISESVIAPGVEVSIEGTGFARKGNSVVTPFGTTSGLESRRAGGRQVITFTPSFAVPKIPFGAGATTTPTTLYVVTANGATAPRIVNVAL